MIGSALHHYKCLGGWEHNRWGVFPIISRCHTSAILPGWHSLNSGNAQLAFPPLIRGGPSLKD
jgi:hypothetical protein